jgi:predicted transcriptional regulator
MLLGGTKTVEFRRRGPGPAAVGKHVLIYASSPVSALVGYGTTLDCVRAEPAELWKCYADSGGIEEHDFVAYFAGCAIGDALLVECLAFPCKVELNFLRAQYHWRPPMSWSWLVATSPLLDLIPLIQR